MEESRIQEGEYRGYRVSVRLVRDCLGDFQPRALNSPREAFEFYRSLSDLDREVFYSTHLDKRNQVISCEEVSRGTLSASLVHPREVFKGAILSSAAAIVVAHNHPSGDPTPSPEDYDLTNGLVYAGKIMGIPLQDSVVGIDRYIIIHVHGAIKQYFAGYTGQY